MDAVKVDGGQVWLRKDISKATETVADTGEPREVTVYVANEVTFVDPSITRDYATEHFDELWDAAMAAQTPTSDRIAKVEAMAQTMSTDTSDLADALADLSIVVSELAEGDEKQ